MDTTSVLDKYTQDLSNLPLEIKHLLQELKHKDDQLQDARRRYQSKDNQLHKFIKANGTLVKHPKEPQLYAKIEEDMALVKKIQKEKILLSNTALFLISKHLYNFETDITKLERDDILPPIESVLEIEDPDIGSGYGENGSTSPPPRLSSTPVVEIKRQGQKRKGTSITRPFKRTKTEDIDFEDSLITGTLNITGGDEERSGSSFGAPPPNNGDDTDNTLYCFCQRVSFGEMIGCDNDDCQYEWFHWGCVGITAPPKDDQVWYCPDCAPKMEKRKKKRKG